MARLKTWTFWKRPGRTNASWDIDNTMDINHSVVNEWKENLALTLPLAFFYWNFVSRCRVC